MEPFEAKGTAKGTRGRLQRYGGTKGQKHKAAKVIETAAVMKTAAKVAKVAKDKSAPRLNVASAQNEHAHI